MRKITPCLWLDDKAEEAARFYTSLFGNSRIVNTVLYGDAGPRPRGTVQTVTFQLAGQDFMALNGGPAFTFTPALSFFVSCETQEEIDRLWDALSAGGKEMQCGWVTDRYGVSWQIVPSVLGDLLGDGASERSSKVMKALLAMKKLDVKRLQQAAEL
ncbi:MAG: VOC family protein [Spirochaetia bacterium]|jgi:predicted 3-demethylubiquinone-9 3-methyltransferase (glyoxalase superfamily)